VETTNTPIAITTGCQSVPWLQSWLRK
jgi:hypothetical protein